MRKSLIALAAVAATGTASAQSYVQLFGVVDVTMAHGSGSISSKTQQTFNGNSANRIGFKGVEDLGGGTAAAFWLESTVTNDNGQGQATNTNNQASGSTAAPNGTQGLTFNRRSTVSLGGTWGELRLGRDYTPSYWALAVLDPFGNLGVGTAQTVAGAITGATSVRASNSIAYHYGHAYNQMTSGALASGFNVSLMYYLGENNSGTPTSHDGNGYSAKVGWTSGPLFLSAGAGKTKNAAGDIQQRNAGAAYDFGVARVIGHYASDKNGPVSASGYLLGVSVPIGVQVVRASYSRYKTDAVGDPSAGKLALGYVYNLSKRTAVFATVARLKNKGTSAVGLNGAVTGAGTGSTGYDVGISHSF